MNSKQRHEARYQRRKAAREAKYAQKTLPFDDFDKVFSFDNLYAAYKKCCLGVGWKASTQRYRVNALLNVNKTYKDLQAGKVKHKGFNEFRITDRGKQRHIKSVHINDRVIERCFCDNSLVPMLKDDLIYDNGACMLNKGIEFAIGRFTCHLERHYRKHGTDGYVLMFDFSKYFDRIDHEKLIAMLEKRYTDKRLLEYVSGIIRSFGGGKGLGLGSQISQVSALLYPSKLDNYIKSVLQIKGYGRYMDDGYLIHHSKEYLQHCLEKMKEICNELGIVLNPKKTQIIKLSRGATFLKTKFSLTSTGAVIKRPCRRNIVVMRRKMKVFKRWYEVGKLALKDIRTSYISWIGYMKHRNAYKTMGSMARLYNNLFNVKEAHVSCA